MFQLHIPISLVVCNSNIVCRDIPIMVADQHCYIYSRTRFSERHQRRVAHQWLNLFVLLFVDVSRDEEQRGPLIRFYSGKSYRARYARLHMPYLDDWPASETGAAHAGVRRRTFLFSFVSS